MVPVIGVEPIRYFYHRILSPARLPIPPHRRTRKLYNIFDKKSSDFFDILAKKEKACYNKIMEKLILIDGNSLLNRAYYAMSVFTTKDGLPTNGIFGFVKLLLKIIDDEQCDYLCVAFDVHAINVTKPIKEHGIPCRRSWSYKCLFSKNYCRQWAFGR